MLRRAGRIAAVMMLHQQQFGRVLRLLRKGVEGLRRGGGFLHFFVCKRCAVDAAGRVKHQQQQWDPR